MPIIPTLPIIPNDVLVVPTGFYAHVANWSKHTSPSKKTVTVPPAVTTLPKTVTLPQTHIASWGYHAAGSEL